MVDDVASNATMSGYAPLHGHGPEQVSTAPVCAKTRVASIPDHRCNTQPTRDIASHLQCLEWVEPFVTADLWWCSRKWKVEKGIDSLDECYEQYMIT